MMHARSVLWLGLNVGPSCTGHGRRVSGSAGNILRGIPCTSWDPLDGGAKFRAGSLGSRLDVLV